MFEDLYKYCSVISVRIVIVIEPSNNGDQSTRNHLCLLVATIPLILCMCFALDLRLSATHALYLHTHVPDHLTYS